MQIELSNSDTTVQLPQSLDSVSLQAPGPLRIEDDGAGVLPAATTLDAGTGLSATDQGDGIVRLDAAASGSGVDVTDSGTAVQTGVNGIDFGTGLDVTADGDGTITVDAAGGVDVPGSDTQVIFNDNGDLGANAGLTYDGQTLTAQAKSGQTDPLLQLNDETGSPLIQDTTSGDREYKTPGKGVILTSPDGSTTSKLTASNAGRIQGAGNTLAYQSELYSDADAQAAVSASDVGLGSVLNNEQVVNAGSTPSLLSDTQASRPPAGTSGRLFVETDTQQIYRDTGSSWDMVAQGQLAPSLLTAVPAEGYDINQGSWTDLSWDGTDRLTSDITPDLSASTFTVEEGGLYRLYVNLATGGSNDDRTNPGVRFSVNGTALRGVSRSTYVRRRQGHNQASTALSRTVELSAGDVVRVQTKSYAASGSTPLVAQDSVFEMEKVAGRKSFSGDASTLAGYAPNDFVLAEAAVVEKGDIEFTGRGQGLVLTSSDGNHTKRVYLDNNGNLQTEPA